MPFPCPDVAATGTLYTLNCESESSRRYTQQLMQHRCCVLVDLRPKPWTKTNPEWTRNALDLRYNIVEQAHLPLKRRSVRYVWDERLTCTVANLSERFDGRPAIARLSEDLLAGRDVILLCACRDESCCRQLVVAKLVQDALAVALFAIKEESRSCRISPEIPSLRTRLSGHRIVTGVY